MEPTPQPEHGATVKVTSEQLAAIDDEDVLNKMLDNAGEFEERRLIRAALRDLLKKKRDKREQERGSRQQDLRQRGLSKEPTPGGGVRGSARATVNQQPATNTYSMTAGGQASPAQATQKCPPSAVPNAKNVKQMLLDWCKAKTEPYEGVDIHNFSSSWKDGIAFCALVHRFFPEAFEYSTLNPNKAMDNFQLAFSTAERLAGCPPLLDPEDLVRMKEPDWKCVYTYIQEFYRCLVEKGLVKTKKRA
ncbi:smoothelin isoform X2 [Hippocampus zosterae]|uniref:smoothelin isoform X2 n=1 Tax=Hippocampus zosterae TaxID=109293 RepID=UPI00223E633B|nr:smoothelin isoform X2 [Hippocampus zosterae]